MNHLKKLLAISGSTREKSSNLQLLHAINAMLPEQVEMEIFQGIASLPHFNPDLDYDNPPAAVTDFRDQVIISDAILICTPEYAMGPPGTLKNALDWLVSSSSFSGKPVGLITASLSGHKAHASLLDTLKMINADTDADTQHVISFIKTKMDTEGKISDAHTTLAVKSLLAHLLKKIPSF